MHLLAVETKRYVVVSGC